MWHAEARMIEAKALTKLRNGFSGNAMRSFSTGGAYLNFTPEADRIRDAYGDEKYERLVALKDKYDPDNLFRLNPNIRPSRQA
jgi:hypothetical protein